MRWDNHSQTFKCGIFRRLSKTISVWKGSISQHQEKVRLFKGKSCSWLEGWGWLLLGIISQAEISRKENPNNFTRRGNIARVSTNISKENVMWRINVELSIKLCIYHNTWPWWLRVTLCLSGRGVLINTATYYLPIFCINLKIFLVT